MSLSFMVCNIDDLGSIMSTSNEINPEETLKKNRGNDLPISTIYSPESHLPDLSLQTVYS